MSAELLGGARALEEVAAARARMCHGFVPVRHGKEGGKKKGGEEIGPQGSGPGRRSIKTPARPPLSRRLPAHLQSVCRREYGPAGHSVLGLFTCMLSGQRPCLDFSANFLKKNLVI